MIDSAQNILVNNLRDIEDLILNKRFVPFPPRQKAFRQQIIPEEYPSKDGFENIKQLNMISRAIFIYPNLVNLWKQIGYNEICDDFNDFVIQNALIILLPPFPASCTTTNTIILRLREFINLGFELHDNVIVNILLMFEHRLDDIGDILWDVFLAIRSSENTTNSPTFKFISEVFLPTKKLKKCALLNFLKSINIEGYRQNI